MSDAIKQRAEAAYRAIQVYAEHAGLKFNADTMVDVTTDLLTSIMHLGKEGYNLNLTDRLAEARLRFLESFLRQAHANQGGEASFEDWVNNCLKWNAIIGEAEFSSNFEDEAVEYLAANGDLSEKNLSESGEWVDASAPTVK